jgi:hypothetical protein
LELYYLHFKAMAGQNVQVSANRFSEYRAHTVVRKPGIVIHFTHALNNISPARHFIIILYLAACRLHGLLFDLESGGDFRLFLLVSCLVYFSTLKMEAICSS